MSKLPEIRTLSKYLRDEKRQTVRMQQSSSFSRSGTSVTAEGVTQVDGTLSVVGNLEVSGHAAITGTLSLPAGIIDNAALANPVVPQGIFFFAQNFAVTTTAATYATQTVTVPAGFTSAVVTVVSRLAAVNSTASADYLSAVTKIAGIGGKSFQHMVAAGQTDFNVSPFSTVLTGLTGGGTFDLEVRGNVQVANWAANTANTAEMTGSILWLR